jgi:hypothetical protein
VEHIGRSSYHRTYEASARQSCDAYLACKRTPSAGCSAADYCKALRAKHDPCQRRKTWPDSAEALAGAQQFELS